MSRSVSIFTAIWILLIGTQAVCAETHQDTSQQKIKQLIQQSQNLCDAEQFDKAEVLLKEAEKIKTDAPEVYKVWGCLYEKKKEWKKAEEKYNQWAKIQPQSYEPYERLGTVAHEQDHYAESNSYLEKAKHLNPTKPYIISYRCHNFLKLEQWQNAIQECSEAIALNPKYKYAYTERSRAYRAIGEFDKADQDLKAAGKSGSSYRHSFMMGKVFPVLIGIISLSFLVIGFAVLIRKKPLLFSSRWMFGMMVICFLPQITNSFLMGDISEHIGGFRVIQWLMPLMFVVLLIFMWIQMQGYIVFGITDKSFRNALISVLEESNLEWKEELSLIHVPSENLDIQVSVQSRMGTGQVKNKTRQNKEAFEHIISGLKKRFAAGNLETNNTTSILYIAIGIIVLVLMGTMLNISSSLS